MQKVFYKLYKTQILDVEDKMLEIRNCTMYKVECIMILEIRSWNLEVSKTANRQKLFAKSQSLKPYCMYDYSGGKCI